MRWLLALLCSATLAAAATPTAVQIVHVWPQWRDADAFDRIREYFGRGEYDGRELVIRTHPEQRAGMYFLVRIKTPVEINGGKFVLEIVRPDSPDPKSFTFPVSMSGKGGVVDLGLTDGDWPGGRRDHPVAWKVTLLDGSGQVLATEHSFLWEKPAK